MPAGFVISEPTDTGRGTMSEKALIERLDALDNGSDFTDPQTYTALLYGEGATDEVVQPAQPEGETAAAPAPEPTPAAAESSATPAAAETTPTEPTAAGVATRDGKHVIPYQVLETERLQRKAADQKLAEAHAEIERLKAQGATPTEQAQAVESLFTDEELADLETDVPQAATALKKLQDAYVKLAARVASEDAAKATAQQAQQELTEEEQRDVARAQAEEAMRDTPLLRQWRDAGGGLWDEAVKAEAALAAQSEWASKTLAERAAQVQADLARKYGIHLPATPKPTQQPQPRQATEVLPTLTDFNGGPMAVGDPMNGMNKGQMVDKAMGMSMEEIRRMVGLSY
jgi:hypothetical protein